MLFDFDAVPPRERYKLLVSTIVPRPVAWVVTKGSNGVVNAAPFSFFNAFAEEPPIIAIGCGDNAAGHKDTLRNIKETGEFTVCLVPYSLIDAMNVTAIDFPPSVSELAEAGLTQAPGSKISVPRIAESPVAIECKLYQAIPLGVHTMVLGQAQSVYVRDDCVMNAEKYYIDTPKLELVGRMHGRGWYARTTDRVEVPRIPLKDWEAKKAQ